MSNWIWFPGDFEIYHIMKQNFSREERGFDWPAYWNASNWNHNVKFTREYHLTEASTFRVHAQGKGHVVITRQDASGNEIVNKYPLDQEITCEPGDITIDLMVCNLEGLPTVFVSGNIIYSNENWQASNYIEHHLPVGTNSLFTQIEQNPMEFPYTFEMREPIQVEHIKGGLLLDFGYDIFAKTRVIFNQGFKEVTLCYGESKTEALDVADCYLKQTIETPRDKGIEQVDENTYTTRLRAFRYIFLPEMEDSSISIIAERQFIDFDERSQFHCADERLNEIWKISDRTFRACSDIFFLDGVKRDRWVWSGDAYQSYFINQYSFFNKEIVERTILGLRGSDPIQQHLNTIIDYSLYWIISIEQHYMTFNDQKFLKMVYPKMKSLLEYCMEQTDENGFIYGRSGDWVYIDWSEFDIQGPLCAEQMLLARAYQSMIAINRELGKEQADLTERFDTLIHNIKAFYWDQEKGAFIDSYESGNRNVTKHANIFAILFQFVNAEEVELIKNNVLLNPQIRKITTPYFKFWELETMATIGDYSYVMDEIKSYWGGMLDEGATTFWEYYDPNETGVDKYAMYGDKYGKSLCHAWGASPIYLLGRYLLGVRSTSPGYKSFEVAPKVDYFDELTCTLPVGEGEVKIEISHGQLAVRTDALGGELLICNQSISLPENETVTVDLAKRD